MLSLSIPLTFKTVVLASTGRLIDIDAQSIAALYPGQPVYVESVRRTFRWDPICTLANDNTTGGTYVQPTAVGGAGRFVWDGVVDPSWVVDNPAMVVDTTATTYEGFGDAANPLPTNAELIRRHGLLCQLRQNYSINWNTSTATSDPWSGKFIVGPNAVFSRVGKKLTTVTGTTSAFTAQNRTPGAQAMPTITDATQTWATLVGRHGTFTSGTAIGAFFVVLKDLGANVARISTPVTFNPSTQAVTRNVPGNVSTYEVYTFPQVTVGTVELYSADTSATTSYVTDDLIEWRQAQVFTLRSNSISKGIRVSSQRTTFFSYNGEADTHVMASCLHTGGPVLSWRGIGSKCIAGGITGNISMPPAAQPVFDLDFCAQGVGVTMAQGAMPQIGTMAIFDSAGGLSTNPGAVVFVLNIGDGAGTIWGTTTSGFGVNCVAGSQLIYNVAGNKPVINSGLGAGRESKQGGVDVPWAAVPVAVNVNNAAGIFVNA